MWLFEKFHLLVMKPTSNLVNRTTQTWPQVNSRIGIDGQFQNWNFIFKKNGIDIFGIEVCYKQINPHDNPIWNINYSQSVFGSIYS